MEGTDQRITLVQFWLIYLPRPAFKLLRKAESRSAYAILFQKLVRFSIRTARTQQAIEATAKSRPQDRDSSIWVNLAAKEANAKNETGNDFDLSDQLVNLEMQYATDDDILEQEAEETPEAQEAEDDDDEDFDFAALVEDDTEIEPSAGEDDDVPDDDESTPPENDVEMSDSDDEVRSDTAPAYPVIMTTKQKEAAVAFTHALESASNDTLSTLLHNLLDGH